VCVDDATRLAYAELLADERGPSAAAFLERAVAWFKSMGIEPRRILSDNGACHRSNAHAEACRELGLRHSFTRPYRPQTNGRICVLGWGCRPIGRRGSPRPAV
jgi:transposase InsO family protein